MSVRPLVVLPDSRLFLCSEEVREEDFGDKICSLVSDMFDTMYSSRGIGLAAVQIGVHKRLFVIDLNVNTRYQVSDGDAREKDGYVSSCGPTVVINPEIVERSGEMVVMEEGCLSVPRNRLESVIRPKRIVMRYTDQNGKRETIRAQGLLARCLQHEIDHLDGVVFLKHLSKLKRDLVMAEMRKAAANNRHT